MLRRRFMLVCTAAVTGLWFRPTGLTTLSRKVVVALSGTCSFCGKAIEEVRSMAGAVGMPTRICDECVGLCLDIIDEEVIPRSERGSYVPRSSELDSDQRAKRGVLGEGAEGDQEEEAILRNLQKVRAALDRGGGGGAYASEIDAMIADSRRRIDGARHRSELAEKQKQEQREQRLVHHPDARAQAKPKERALPSDLACTFCDARQSEVKKLIAGPLVYICDGCVGEAAVITQALLDRAQMPYA